MAATPMKHALHPWGGIDKGFLRGSELVFTYSGGKPPPVSSNRHLRSAGKSRRCVTEMDRVTVKRQDTATDSAPICFLLHSHSAWEIPCSTPPCPFCWSSFSSTTVSLLYYCQLQQCTQNGNQHHTPFYSLDLCQHKYKKENHLAIAHLTEG